MIVDAYSWNAGNATAAGTITLYLRNVGNSEVELDAVYLGGVMVATSMSTTLPVQGPVVQVDLTTTGTYTSGVAYTMKCITKTGGVFTYSLICGSGQ